MPVFSMKEFYEECTIGNWHVGRVFTGQKSLMFPSEMGLQCPVNCLVVSNGNSAAAPAIPPGRLLPIFMFIPESHEGSENSGMDWF